MNLQAIIVLLQTILALLSIPNPSPSLQVEINSMVAQATSLATQALQEVSATTSIPVYNPPAWTQNVGAPSLAPDVTAPSPSAPVSVPSPTCTITAKVSSSTDPAGVILTSLNWSGNGDGILYVLNGQNGGEAIWAQNGFLNDRTRSVVRFPWQKMYKAQFDDATCFTFLYSQDAGTISTATVPTDINISL